MNETHDYEEKQRFEDLPQDCGKDEEDQCRAEDHARRYQTVEVEIVCNAPDPFQFDVDFCLRCPLYYSICEVKE